MGVRPGRTTVDKHRKVINNLTSRQREVLRLVAEGRSAREIGSLLNISSRTVEYHKYRLMDELNLKTSAELIRFAIKHGVVSD
jgi:DNA-binding NarL/FixJ family response regulator